MKIGDCVRTKTAINMPWNAEGETTSAGVVGVILAVDGRDAFDFIVNFTGFDAVAMCEFELEIVVPGRWQRKMPKAAGVYWTRTLDGEEAGPCVVAALPDGQLFTPRFVRRDKGVKIPPGTCFGGWWWSEPMPPCPPFQKPEGDE